MLLGITMFIRPSHYITHNGHSFLTDEQILMKLYSVVVCNLTIWMKEDTLGPIISREIIEMRSLFVRDVSILFDLTHSSSWTHRTHNYMQSAKPRLSQVNVRQNLSATGRNFGFTCHNYKYPVTVKCCSIFNDVTGKS